MRRLPWELVYAFLGILTASGIYSYLARSGTLSPSSRAGYILGILGFVLMLKTEFVYTLRKKLKGFVRGRISFWLKFHIVTGLVGPFLILLHSGWKFHGLAGTAAIVLLLVVLSGFIGRYIYTAAPRSITGNPLEAGELERDMAALDGRIRAIIGNTGLRLPREDPPSGTLSVLARPWLKWKYRAKLNRLKRGWRRNQLEHASELAELLGRKYEVQLQWQSLAATRKLLAIWHMFHVPLGAVLFSLAFLHIGGALYYSLKLR